MDKNDHVNYGFAMLHQAGKHCEILLKKAIRLNNGILTLDATLQTIEQHQGEPPQVSFSVCKSNLLQKSH